VIEMKDIYDKILWTKGYEAGVEAERNRAIRLAQHISVMSEPAIGEPKDIVFLDDLIAYLFDKDEK